MYKRPLFKTIFERLKSDLKFIQILSGPRQSGKTTLINQVLKEIDIPSHYSSADFVSLASNIWIEEQWNYARIKIKKERKEIILVLDEIQKISGWTETVKKLWEEDRRNGHKIKVVLLGSSPLLIQNGLKESLAGRFEIIRIPHWSFNEISTAFQIDIDQYIYFGGYPGSISLINDENRWKQYIRDSLIETTIARDILLITRIDKPILLRKLFELGCLYSGQILSYNKILGQIQEAGNTTTLAHYLDLLSASGMLCGLQKYTSKKIRQRSSSPKFQVLNNALISAQMAESFDETRSNSELWGRLVESSIGAHLVNLTRGSEIEVTYWREANKEVDFVLSKGKELVAIEVKSGKKMDTLQGMKEFSSNFPVTKKLLVGNSGIDIGDFFDLSLDEIMD